jgi:hypothetical protein
MKRPVSVPKPRYQPVTIITKPEPDQVITMDNIESPTNNVNVSDPYHKKYDKVIVLKNAAAGDVSNDRIKTCYICKNNGWPHEALRNAGSYYRNSIPRWYDQKHYIEDWVESGTAAKTIRGYIGNRQVRVAYNKGNPGWKFAYDNSLRLKTELERTEHFHYDPNAHSIKQIHIFYFGDDDKHGNDMDLLIKNN